MSKDLIPKPETLNALRVLGQRVAALVADDPDLSAFVEETNRTVEAIMDATKEKGATVSGDDWISARRLRLVPIPDLNADPIALGEWTKGGNGTVIKGP